MESPSMLVPMTNVIGSSPPVSFLNRYYILLKAHYFLFFSAFGMLYPILSITLRSRGLSNTEISYINLIIPFLVFFTNPLMGFLADHSRRYLVTFNLILAIVIISYSIMFILPPIKTDNIQAKMFYDDPSRGPVLDFCASQEVATKCSSRSECGCSYQSYCQQDNISFNFTFSMNATNTHEDYDNSGEPTCEIKYQVPVDNYLNLSSTKEKTSSIATCGITCSIAHFCHGRRFPHQTLYIFLYWILFVIGTNFLSNAITIGASIGFSALPSPDTFGQQRVWGTIGFGISALAASRLYQRFNTEFVYIIMFSITSIICIFVTSFIFIQPYKHKRSIPNDNPDGTEPEMANLSERNSTKIEEKKDKSQSKIAALIPLLKRIDVIVFLSLTFIWGMSYAGLDPYVFLHLDEISPCHSRSIIGWMSLVAAISEVIAFYLAARLIKLCGTNLSSVIIFLAFAVRFSGYYYIERPYFIIFVETMHFFNFGILYVLISLKADAIAPPGLSGTLQGVVYGISFGLGRGIGLIVSSFIYTRFQPRYLFLFFALFNTIAAGIYSLYFLWSSKRSQRSKRATKNTNIPKIVIDSEPNINEEPLLISSQTNSTNHTIIDQ